MLRRYGSEKTDALTAIHAGGKKKIFFSAACLRGCHTVGLLLLLLLLFSH
jgi:hypothetical protein